MNDPTRRKNSSVLQGKHGCIFWPLKRRWVGEPRLHSQKENPKPDYYNIPNPRKTLRKTVSTESSSWVLQAKPIKSPIKMSITQCFCRRATPKQAFSVMLKWLTSLRNIFRAALSEDNCLSTVTTNQDTSHLQGVSLSSILLKEGVWGAYRKCHRKCPAWLHMKPSQQNHPVCC